MAYQRTTRTAPSWCASSCGTSRRAPPVITMGISALRAVRCASARIWAAVTASRRTAAVAHVSRGSPTARRRASDTAGRRLHRLEQRWEAAREVRLVPRQDVRGDVFASEVIDLLQGHRQRVRRMIGLERRLHRQLAQLDSTIAQEKSRPR
jgi:hypothetical protein